MSNKHVIIVEDEPDIAQVIEYNLIRNGLDVSVKSEGESALASILKKRCDLVILDLMLPGMDGLEICRRIRADDDMSFIPIIMVTARGDEADVVLGLGLGADDYVTKPFSPKELIERVKAVLRRGTHSGTTNNTSTITIDGFHLDPEKHRVKIDGKATDFTASEFRILHLLAAHPGRVFTRDQMLTLALGDDAIVLDRNIDVHIRATRKKLGPYRDFIETVRGVGYRFRDPEF